MSFTGAQINKLDGGLGGGEPAGRVAVLVIGAGAIPDKLELYKAYELLQIEDAEARGITAESDTANQELSYYHLSEIFRLSPETSVHVIAVPKATKESDLKNLTEFIAALRSIPNVNTIGVAGLTDDADIGVAVTGMQLLADDLKKDFIYIDVAVIEGKGAYLTGATVADYPALREYDSETIMPVWAQDPAIVALDDAYENHAAVGSALGMLLVRSIHENLGSVDIEVKPKARKAEQDYTLTDVKTGRWLSAALSNGKKFETLSGADQKKLDELGYNYVGVFAGYGGYFFSDSHTCTEADSDYCYAERNAIWNKGARIIRATLIPRIRSKVESDPGTGYIKNTTITDWDGRVRKALEEMVRARDIAAFDIYINPKQAAVSTRPFNIKVQFVADGVVHEFEVDLGFTRSV
ncbi:DUF2586 family protein [Dysgonomonas termitidis]|uniref:DUF2586 family protein n=1 Tax=Dysgonomonas termitidis TaxID=1516126 RepID=A0ABV9KU77_9BACT